MERESDLEQRERKDQETSEVRKARQVRLGHVPAPPEEEEPEPEEEKPETQSKSRTRTKKT